MVRSHNIQPLYEEAMDLISNELQISEFHSVKHVYREQNWESDELANDATVSRTKIRTPRGTTSTRGISS